MFRRILDGGLTHRYKGLSVALTWQCGQEGVPALQFEGAVSKWDDRDSLYLGKGQWIGVAT